MGRTIYFFTFFSLLLASCGQLDQPVLEKAERLNQLRGDFQFTMNPGSERATGLVRFSFSANSTGVGLPGASFYLDGKQLTPDSTDMNGVFYELEIPAADFFRQHTIELRTGSETHTDQFTPQPFSMEPGFRDADREQDLPFGLKGVADGESVMVSMVDTSFDNNDLVRKFPVLDNQLNITAADLQNLSPGPISAEIQWEKKIPLSKLGLKRAVVTIRQGVVGEFLLK